LLDGCLDASGIGRKSIPYWTAVSVTSGSILRLKAIQGQGTRTYLAVQHGFNVPDYLSSKSTFTLGKFGGHCGRTLRIGDVLRINPPATPELEQSSVPCTLPPQLIPEYSSHWEIGVLYGPHGAPDFFTDEDIEMFFSTDWEVHYNSARTGTPHRSQTAMGKKRRW
jgi:urea carboxylase